MNTKNTKNTKNTTNTTKNTTNTTNTNEVTMTTTNTFAMAKATAAASNVKMSQLYGEAVKPTRLAFQKARAKALRALDKCTSDKFDEWKATLRETFISAEAEMKAFETANLAACAKRKRTALDEAEAKRKAKEDAKARDEALLPYKNKAHDLLLEALKKAPNARKAYEMYTAVCAGATEGISI